MGLPQGVLVKKDHGTTQRDRPSHQLFGKSSFTRSGMTRHQHDHGQRTIQ